jgi:hypothetical protein
MESRHEQFVAVGLGSEESHISADIELNLLGAAVKGLSSGALPTILMCDQIGTIAGYEQYARVFFLNRAAWGPWEAAGMLFGAMRTVRRSEIPANHIRLAGPSSETPDACMAGSVETE